MPDITEVAQGIAHTAHQMHSASLAAAKMLGECAVGHGLRRAENPFRRLPHTHPLREQWDFSWEQAYCESSNVVPA